MIAVITRNQTKAKEKREKDVSQREGENKREKVLPERTDTKWTGTPQIEGSQSKGIIGNPEKEEGYLLLPELVEDTSLAVRGREGLCERTRDRRIAKKTPEQNRIKKVAFRI